MRTRFRTALSAFPFIAYIAWDNFGKPIWSVNVERWAEQRSLDQALNQNIDQIPVRLMPEWMIEWINFLTGDFIKGAATLGLFFLAVDSYRWLKEHRKKRKIRHIDKSELSEKCHFLATLIRANEPFLGNKHISFIDIKLEVWEIIRDIGHLIDRKIPTEIYFKKLRSWPAVLDEVGAELKSHHSESMGNVEKILCEFAGSQLQQSIEEGKKP